METYTDFYKNCIIKRLLFEDVIKLNNMHQTFLYLVQFLIFKKFKDI